MRLFISYAHDDKAWVLELWRALRDRAHHDVWIDQQIVPAQDWWDTILTNIERAEAVIYVMTPKSVGSIYCRAEISYAIELNKPIIPLMLKSCEFPDELQHRRIQYQSVTAATPLADVLLTISNALIPISGEVVNGHYTAPNPLPARPFEPKPTHQPEQISEIFMLAEEAASEHNFTLAEKLFQQVIKADPGVYGLAAAERLGEIRYESVRDAAYLNIVQMTSNPILYKGARALWRVFRIKYGTDYDPRNLTTVFVDDISEKKSKPRLPVSTDNESPATDSESDAYLPAPFGWVEIPAGRVEIQVEGVFEVETFDIAKYPITNMQYEMFVKANGYHNQAWWTETGWLHRERLNWTEPRFWRDKEFNGDEQPVVGVSWYEAVAFCQWLSMLSGETITLPTTHEWQRAAQGDGDRMYPWGNAPPDETLCNYAFKVGHTTSVLNYPAGASSFGVMDMVGNVWEWCITAYKQVDTELAKSDVRIQRGGAWPDTLADNLRVTYVNYRIPRYRLSSWGFRCVRLRDL